MFQRLARERLADARVLYAARHYSGAYYLAGYSVECALKAVICKSVQRHTLPERKLLSKDGVFQHNLDQLLTLSGLGLQLRPLFATNPGLERNWLLVKYWTEESRYTKTRKLLARDFIAAVADGADAILPWLEARW